MPIDRTLAAELRRSFSELRRPLRTFRAEMLGVARRGGLTAVHRCYAHWWTIHVGVPRRRLAWRTAQVAAHTRLARTTRDVARRYPDRGVTVPTRGAVLALHRAWTRPRGRGRDAWHLTDLTWPADRYIQRRFFATLDDWVRRAASRRHVRELQAVGAWGFAGLVPKMDPAKADLSLPEDDDPLDLIEQALDNVAVERGQYFAAVGIRDLAHEVDQMTAKLTSQRVPVIIGWRWTLSDAHTEEKCPKGECLTYATEDVGHPHGPGVYFDLLFPQAHPNCWCSMEPEYADDDDLDDPNWTEPVPDEDYEDRVTAVVEQFHTMEAAAA